MDKRRISSSSSEDEEEQTNFHIINKKFDTIISNQEKMKKALESHTNALGNLTEEIFSIKKIVNKNTNQHGVAKKCLPNEPFSEKRQLDSFEENMCVVDFFGLVVHKIQGIVGKGPHDFVCKCWRMFLTDNLAQNFSWIGTKEKETAKSLKITEAIKSNCLIHRKTIK